jgi:hypothetical protein
LIVSNIGCKPRRLTLPLHVNLDWVRRHRFMLCVLPKSQHFGKFEMNLLKIAVFGESVFPCCGSVGIAAGEVVGFGILKQYSEVL